MQTNQTADPSQAILPPLACAHAPGESTAQTCAYLRAVARVRGWTERAEQAQREGADQQPLLGELYVLFAEVQAAHDLCPDHVAQPVSVALLH
jgi:hypothetical protein